MKLYLLMTIPALALATLDPCASNTKNKVPVSPACAATKTSTGIQAAECAYNTRTSSPETFAVWTLTKTNSNGISYGTCEAYTCEAPTSDEIVEEEGGWTFFWNDNGEDDGVGTGCIRDPNTTECGCENSDGTFVVGSDSCV
ncbi:hypothetical protein K458DRAFT_418235 [Lentithecium fluviatile CBS 122367]|uniref:Small secreted protein n=1 Tax=Lentithecium fluviatile CBS 122367 TaxID=1168545 RepID=A0A6G1J157_9PLEO|nr:hypothetical protein K458DRAFT_418235 [Lentithecium fluviatile CBS 122367]